jgi:hypothetical protein
MGAIQTIIKSFLEQVGLDVIEVYNEFSLEHELGIYFRKNLVKGYKVQFERPVNFFFSPSDRLEKKEIDIAIFTPDKKTCHAIEPKFPRAGQHPEQMFKSCQDIAFIEQLVKYGFSTSYFLILVEDHLFYEGNSSSRIYKYFRAGEPITAKIQKPTGSKDKELFIEGSYIISWDLLDNNMRYALVEVG